MALLAAPVAAWLGATSLDLAADVAPTTLRSVAAPLVAGPAQPHAEADSLDRFGFPTWGYTVDTLRLARGVSLNAVFVSEGIDLNEAASLVAQLGKTVQPSVTTVTETALVRTRRGRRVARKMTRRIVDDHRLLGAGDALYVYRDSADVSHFVYEPDFRSYVVLTPTDSVAFVREIVRPEVHDERVVRAAVQPGGLPRVFADADAPASLADSVSAIFAQRFGVASTLKRGDSLAVVFPESHVDTTVTDTGAVLAVRLRSGAKALYAFRYTTHDGRTDYYDEKGQNWRDFFLAAPIKGSVVTSAYSMARFHPILEYWKPHLGTDFSAPMGAPILALADGTILEATFSGGNGNYVKMQHDATYTTGYLHMSRLGEGIVPGKKVRQGDVIGYVGMTGLATGPHTCLRFYRNGAQVDFQRQPWTPAPGIPAAERKAFVHERNRLMARLATPPVASPLLAMTTLTRL